MQPTIRVTKTVSENSDQIILLKDATSYTETVKDESQSSYIRKKLESGESTLVHLNFFDRRTILVYVKPSPDKNQEAEEYRKKAFEIANILNTEKCLSVQITSQSNDLNNVLALCEGLALSSYQFLKYKSEKKENTLKEFVVTGSFEQGPFDELATLIKATCIARDLVNEPVIYLTAEQFSEEIKNLGKDAGFEVDVFSESKIKSLKMGGLLAVNEGSPNPPTFNILEYKPENATNVKPIVLVGKGVVYDTGGLSLKPTPNSMDYMKCDMAGGAAVVGCIYAIAQNKLPVYVVGLIPATENRPDGNAITPGDVITMFSGKTVEVLNTDAEGRLILADALSYASKYNPMIAVDVATLTGSAVAAIGKEGIVYMGNAAENFKKELTASGNRVYERLVEFPLWAEYGKAMESDIADLKNIGGPTAGAITAGKFLEHFVNYDWLHLDIAASAFLSAPDSYRGKNGTGVGVRLLYDFIKSITVK